MEEKSLDAPQSESHPQTPEQSHVSSPPGSGPSKMLLILGGVLLLALGVAGGWYYGRSAVSVENTEVEITPTVVVEDDMAGWETYVNEEYGFKFQYPSNWSFEGKMLTSSTTTESLSILINSPIGLECHQTVSLEEEILLGNKKATKTVMKGVDSENCDQEKSRLVVIGFNNSSNDSIQLMFGYAESEEEISLQNFDQILSTFEFVEGDSEAKPTNQATIRTIQHTSIPSWETYVNEFIGLTLQYPPGYKPDSEIKDGNTCSLSFANAVGEGLIAKTVPYTGGSRRQLYGIKSGYEYSFEEAYIQGIKSLIIEQGPIGESGSGSGVVIPQGKYALMVTLDKHPKDGEWFQNLLKSISITELTGNCG